MQAGPGAENAFAGVATAYSDSVPLLCLPVGHPRSSSQVFHFFRSVESYAPITKWIEELTAADQVPEVMRRAFTYVKMGRPGPVMVEIPGDVALEDFSGARELHAGEAHHERRQSARRGRGGENFVAGEKIP
jgi:acetolactate synthase-1/2/3 large subunit